MNRKLVNLSAGLSRFDFFDDEIREKRLATGEQVARSIAGIEICQTLNAACALIVNGSDSALRELDTALTALGIGSVAFDSDKPSFRAPTLFRKTQ